MANDAGRELLILGMLRRKPMSAYDLSNAVHRHAPLYRTFKSGNIYHAVKRLAERSLLQRSTADARRGKADSKTIFNLSVDRRGVSQKPWVRSLSPALAARCY